MPELKHQQPCHEDGDATEMRAAPSGDAAHRLMLPPAHIKEYIGDLPVEQPVEQKVANPNARATLQPLDEKKANAILEAAKDGSGSGWDNTDCAVGGRKLKRNKQGIGAAPARSLLHITGQDKQAQTFVMHRVVFPMADDKSLITGAIHTGSTKTIRLVQEINTGAWYALSKVYHSSHANTLRHQRTRSLEQVLGIATDLSMTRQAKPPGRRAVTYRKNQAKRGKPTDSLAKQTIEYTLRPLLGTDLQRILDNSSRPNAETLFSNFIQSLLCCMVFNASGFIHKDIKLGNFVKGIVADAETKFNPVRLIDLDCNQPLKYNAAGVAEFAHAAVAGTPSFMPPEVITGMTAGTFSDVYSFGASWLRALNTNPNDTPANSNIKALEGWLSKCAIPPKLYQRGTFRSLLRVLLQDKNTKTITNTILTNHNIQLTSQLKEQLPKTKLTRELKLKLMRLLNAIPNEPEQRFWQLAAVERYLQAFQLAPLRFRHRYRERLLDQALLPTAATSPQDAITLLQKLTSLVTLQPPAAAATKPHHFSLLSGCQCRDDTVSLAELIAETFAKIDLTQQVSTTYPISWQMSEQLQQLSRQAPQLMDEYQKTLLPKIRKSQQRIQKRCKTGPQKKALDSVRGQEPMQVILAHLLSPSYLFNPKEDLLAWHVEKNCLEKKIMSFLAYQTVLASVHALEQNPTLQAPLKHYREIKGQPKDDLPGNEMALLQALATAKNTSVKPLLNQINKKLLELRKSSKKLPSFINTLCHKIKDAQACENSVAQHKHAKQICIAALLVLTPTTQQSLSSALPNLRPATDIVALLVAIDARLGSHPAEALVDYLVPQPVRLDAILQVLQQRPSLARQACTPSWADWVGAWWQPTCSPSFNPQACQQIADIAARVLVDPKFVAKWCDACKPPESPKRHWKPKVMRKLFDDAEERKMLDKAKCEVKSFIENRSRQSSRAPSVSYNPIQPSGQPSGLGSPVTPRPRSRNS